jgi:hypothetical protein
MRSLMGRHRDFWGLTEDGLTWATKILQLDLTADKKKQLMEAYPEPRCFPGCEARPRGSEEARGQACDSVQWRAQDVGGGGEERGNS